MKCKMCDSDEGQYGIGGFGFLCFDHWQEYMNNKKEFLQKLLDDVKES